MKNYLVIGIIGLLLVLILGCTSQHTNKYSYETVQGQLQQENNSSMLVQEKIAVPAITQPSSASAMDWYHIALNEAVSWEKDAKLIEVRGTNKDGSKYYPTTGETNEWIYTFVSVDSFSKYTITVREGVITATAKYDENFALALYNNSPSGNDWVIDSTGAVDIVNTKADGNSFLQTSTNIKANYLLRLSGDLINPIEWTISYFPEHYSQNFIVYVDGKTGELI